MPEENSAAYPKVETKVDSVGSLVMNIFFEPSRVFKRIKLKPTWLIPIIILIVATVLHMYITTPYQIASQKEQIRQSVELTPEQKEQQLTGLEMWEKFAWIGSVVGGVVISLIMVFLGSAMLLFLANIVFGSAAKYSQFLSLFVFASLTGVIGMIVKTPLMIWKGSYDVRTSLAVLLPGSDLRSPLAVLLTMATDLFMIWEIVLLILGLKVICDFTTGRAAASVLIPFAALVGISTLLAAVF